MEKTKRALVSVSDKTGAVEFAKGLKELGYEIISTGGTAKALKDAGVETTEVSSVTGFPECLDGRVKTLHPAIHAGILAMRSNPKHMEELSMLGIETIDIVCVNLYPFKNTVMRGADFAECVENIDIGGPTMLRAAAKNYQDVAVVVDPADYGVVLDELKAGGVSLGTKKRLQFKVFSHTAAYDSMISNYLASSLGIKYPDTVTYSYEKAQGMRYGENPQQSAVFYNDEFIKKGSLSTARQLWGKELSYNNINDANGALMLLKEFGKTPAVVASKHANPCGVGCGDTIYEAYMRAYESDPVSVFGGILAINGEVDEKTAAEINKIFIEIVMAPSYSEKALEILESKKNIRLLQIEDISAPAEAGALDMKKVYGGLLVQGFDTTLLSGEDMTLFERRADVEETTLENGKVRTSYGLGVVTKRMPTKDEIDAMMFSWRVVKHTKSNAIVIGKKGRTTGIGMGQTNRIWAAQQAIEHAGKEAAGSVMASDAFFPFSDCAEECAKAGVTAIIQPGGSIRDKDSVDACDAAGIAMVFVGDRHFRH
ncbi:MAG: bifunctional phosphoribosylaminoimidazolecarboxamide formyltransferase/IMP cyclohydrolase [Clostridia bacterium]|nr:bifunctional phosphoribosylaminoimidazolecarboxamide formyltransferase/IMP cyclohydrolase [Clostridia bacterium]